MAFRLCWLLLFSLVSSFVVADGSSIKKVYEPYVQPLEKELEYQVLIERDNVEFGEQRSKHKLGFGASFTDSWFTELSVVYSDTPSFDLEAYELEMRFQLTEQGEYASDWGLMLEVEKENSQDAWEVALGVLNVYEWQRWQLTSNLFLGVEGRAGVNNEVESAAAMQLKYRHSSVFEPGLEVFVSEDTKAVGLVFMGSVKVSTTDKLFWQLGALVGMNATTPDTTIKFLLEYELF